MRSTMRLAGLAIAALLVAGCSAAAPGWSYAPTNNSSSIPSNGAVAGQPSPASTMPMASAMNANGGMPGMNGGMTGMGMTAGGSTGGTTGASLGTLEVHAFDLGFNPATLSVAQPGRYTIKLVNDGAMTHNVTFADGTSVSADSKQSASADVTVPAGGLAFSCSLPGHADAGMKGQIAVTGGAAPSSNAAAAPAAAASPGAVEQADPNAPPYVERDPTAPAVMSGTVHDVDFPIIEKDMTVAKGFVDHVWTFGGTVPGPTIRVHIGDTVRVHLTNETAMSHSIDFHASQTAMDDQMVEIKPGATWTYTFKADYAGVWMYHCGTAPALEHIANGMFGMVIVEPKGGLAKVDKELAFVQSEWYLGGQGQIASYGKANAANPAPDFVVFNGVASQYKDNPIPVKAGDRVRIFVLNAGPNEDSSFHIVGTIFDTVIKEGIELLKGNAGGWGSQAVDLAPAQGAIIELTIPETGMYAFVTHAFNFVGKGAIGALQAAH